MSTRRSLACLLPFVLLTACSDGGGGVTPTTIEALYPEGCDPIVDVSFCGYPFPTDTWTDADASSPTGRRVHFHATHMRPKRHREENGSFYEYFQNPALFTQADGFSAGNQILFMIPGATMTGVAPVTDLARSLEADSPIVVLDAETGARVPHWAEIDPRAEDQTRAVIMVQPSTRLASAHRYIVAVRGLVDADGRVLEPTAAFRALRDGRSLKSEPSVAARRAKYEGIFDALEAAGVAREGLQLAWDFTTASDGYVTARLGRMLQSGLDELNDAAPAYTITSMQDDVDADIARRIEGTVSVPMYLTDDGGPGDTMVLDADGMPVRQGTVQVPFLLQIPRSAVGTSGSAAKTVLQHGHGLFGSRTDADSGAFRSFADDNGYVLVSLDWWGLSGAADLLAVGAVGTSGDLEVFKSVPDRGQQAMLNFVYGMRAVLRGLAGDPATAINGYPTIDPMHPRYLGVSLGGIYGSVLTTVSPDIERAVLMVPGQSFSLLLPRNSGSYGPVYSYLANNSLLDTANIPLAIGLVQMLWDRVEPTGYTHLLQATPTTTLPFATMHEAFVMDAIGDKTVTTLGAHVMARTMGLPLLAPAPRPVFGLTEMQGPLTGSVFAEFDFGPTESTTQFPNPAAGDPHGALVFGSGSAIPRQMAADYLRTGVVTNLCSGACDPN